MSNAEPLAIQVVHEDGVVGFQIFRIALNHVPGTPQPALRIETDNLNVLGPAVLFLPNDVLNDVFRRRVDAGRTENLIELAFGEGGPTSDIKISYTFGNNPQVGLGMTHIIRRRFQESDK